MCKKDGSSFCLFVSKECGLPKVEVWQSHLSALWRHGLRDIGEVPADAQGIRIHLPLYPQYLPWIVQTYYAEFRSRVPFKEDIWNDAKKVFNHLNRMHNCNREKGCTSVFVHMRMGDYAGHMGAKNWGPDVFRHTNYLQNAFKNVTEIFKKPVFYILGYTNQEVQAFFENHKEDFKGMTIVIVAPVQEKLFKDEQKDLVGIDMALMAMSDVLVMSYGSYGDFGGLLGKDKKRVLYPQGHKTHFETRVNTGIIPRFLPIPWTYLNDTHAQ
ncbi:uncharacterized protein LOC142340207 isoform X2 [Convolutriloba macropyga]|uniref:uncharacterized protein LOC142340207 isoform X2 n=1 Tax=Convolutriloba macropyga TaxID=536237 RepID=UPI003F51E666